MFEIVVSRHKIWKSSVTIFINWLQKHICWTRKKLKQRTRAVYIYIHFSHAVWLSCSFLYSYNPRYSGCVHILAFPFSPPILLLFVERPTQLRDARPWPRQAWRWRQGTYIYINIPIKRYAREPLNANKDSRRSLIFFFRARAGKPAPRPALRRLSTFPSDVHGGRGLLYRARGAVEVCAPRTLSFYGPLGRGKGEVRDCHFIASSCCCITPERSPGLTV